jgi:hypothetical protein
MSSLEHYSEEDLFQHIEYARNQVHLLMVASSKAKESLIHDQLISIMDRYMSDVRDCKAEVERRMANQPIQPTYTLRCDNGDVQRLYQLPNGLGASVVFRGFDHGGYDFAAIRWTGPSNWNWWIISGNKSLDDLLGVHLGCADSITDMECQVKLLQLRDYEVTDVEDTDA